MPRAAPVSTPACNAWALAPRFWWPTPPGRRPGGSRIAAARRSMPFCSTRPAAHRASCGATRMCAGCAARPTSPHWPPCKPGCCAPCGRCCGRGDVCCTAVARCSVPKGMPKCKRFLHTTPMHDCYLRRAICYRAARTRTGLSRTMLAVITTDSFTHCCINCRHETPGGAWVGHGSWHRWLMGACCCLLACCLLLPQAQVQAQVQVAGAETGELQLERADDGLYLSANLQLGLPQLAEDALYKGIPMFFAAEAQVLRARSYW